MARECGIISGYPDNSVRPYGKITRGEVFKIFCVALDIKDVGPTPTPTVYPPTMLKSITLAVAEVHPINQQQLSLQFRIQYIQIL